MKLFIIGRILEENKVVAYKLYNPTNKESRVYSKGDINKAAQKGINIVGLHVTQTGRVAETKDIFNVSKSDLLDGDGNPIDKPNTQAVISVIGFSNKKQYRLVNSKGEESLVKQNELEDLIDQGKINGARRNNKGKISFNENCTNREYDR